MSGHRARLWRYLSLALVAACAIPLVQALRDNAQFRAGLTLGVLLGLAGAVMGAVLAGAVVWLRARRGIAPHREVLTLGLGKRWSRP